jgi:N-acetylmuramoyl-L-alanine amidase
MDAARAAGQAARAAGATDAGVQALWQSPVVPIAVTLTRDSDIDVALTARADMANAWRSDAFISLHCNAAVSRQAHGFEVFTSPGQDRSDVLAEEIIKTVAQAFPVMRIRRDMADGDSDKEARFTVLTRARVPAVLVEMAFISNPAEERLLASADFQRRMAQAIASGVFRFLD